MVSGWFGKQKGGSVDSEMAHGLPVIVYARWVLVVAGIGFAVWNSDKLAELQVSLVLILGLAVANFFLHVEVVKKRTVDRRIVYAMSAADLVAITAVIISKDQFGVDTYVFFLPALLAISVTFRTAVTALYTGVTAVAYGIIGAAVGVSANLPGGDIAAALIAHLVVLVAVPYCGNVYWRIERARREREGELESVRQGLVASPGNGGTASQEQDPAEVRNA